MHVEVLNNPGKMLKLLLLIPPPSPPQNYSPLNLDLASLTKKACTVLSTVLVLHLFAATSSSPFQHHPPISRSSFFALQ